ncbi:hypothetical protein [Pseudaminobacter sp. NGMCC 1.201702]|uniref:hypothetical protein n=1 Tax=Pseudaminobacter sp. NGMCC 1.201702 TaxID=3391825 RepID=UPI0039EECA9C
MSSNQIIEGAISTLANTMRMYVEAHLRFGRLFKVDPEEAIDNLDRTFEMKLEAFHMLYDVSKRLFPYFDHGDTIVLIAVRNAIHHRDHPLFRSLNRRLHLEGGLDRWRGASFLLGSHPTLHGAPIRMSHHVRLDDLDARLDPSHASPYLDTFVSGDRAVRRLEVIDGQLGLPTIRERGLQNRYPKDQIYLDLMPIFVSAVCKVFKAMKAAGLAFKGFDAETYVIPFASELEVDLGSPVLKQLRLSGLGPLDPIPL